MSVLYVSTPATRTYVQALILVVAVRHRTRRARTRPRLPRYSQWGGIRLRISSSKVRPSFYSCLFYSIYYFIIWLSDLFFVITSFDLFVFLYLLMFDIHLLIWNICLILTPNLFARTHSALYAYLNVNTDARTSTIYHTNILIIKVTFIFIKSNFDLAFFVFCNVRSTRTDNKKSSAFTSTFGSRPSSSQGVRDSTVGRDQEKNYVYSNSKSSMQKRTELDVRLLFRFFQFKFMSLFYSQSVSFHPHHHCRCNFYFHWLIFSLYFLSFY